MLTLNSEDKFYSFPQLPHKELFDHWFTIILKFWYWKMWRSKSLFCWRTNSFPGSRHSVWLWSSLWSCVCF